jgi:hypothetical protein
MTALELFVNHRQMLRDELDLFIKYYKGDQPEVISALADKIEWICIEKGSPSSVIPMLKSIIKGKLKIWAEYSNSNYDRGDQLNPRMHKAHLDRVVGEGDYIKGHFRWNFRAYMANYETRNYIEDFYIKKDFQKLREESEKALDLTKMRMSVKYARVWKNTDTQYVIDVTTHNNNDYRYFFSTETGMQTNCGTKPLNDMEKKWVFKMVASKYPEMKKEMKECLN